MGAADAWVACVGVLIRKVERRRTLKPGLASLGFEAKEKKRKNGNSANHIQLLTNPVWREV